jgi:hypothetical protein
LDNPAEILARSKVAVSPATFTIVSLAPSEFIRLMQNPEVSPRMSAPFMILKDDFEVTMLLDEVDFGTMRHALREAKVGRGYRLLTFDLELDLTVVGFMANISRILADAAIPILALSAFTRDHLLIRQQDLSNALKALGPHVGELC